MTGDEIVARLRGLQREARALRAAAESPALARHLELVELSCHMARWEIGDVEAMTPELDRL